MTTKPEPSPEVRAMMQEFVRINKEKYGPDWKNILAKQMAEKAVPVLSKLLELQKKK